MLRHELEPRTAGAGEMVIRQGAPADGLYVIASGRLQAVLTRDDGSQLVLGESGRGELTGETALLNNAPRSASVIALRASQLFFLSTDAFDRVVHAHPQALRVISTALIGKLMTTLRRGPTTSPATSITVVPLDETRDVGELGGRLATSLERLVDSVRVVGSADMRAELGDAPSDLARVTWCEQLEATHDGA